MKKPPIAEWLAGKLPVIAIASFALAVTVLLLLSRWPSALPVGQPAGQTAADAPSPPDTLDVPAKPKPATLSRHIAEYHIGVRYDAKSQSLHGEQIVTWTHPGKKPTGELYFHLYPNAFRSMDTTFMKESGGRLRNSTMKDNSFAAMEISSIKTQEGIELMHRLHYVRPDDGNPADQTLVRLRLPSPVEPGGSVTLQIKFSVKLPQAFARMGVAGDFVMAGQWFPKLAAYEPAGTRNRKEEGWHLHQYHGNSEFYADFGTYNVTIEVPDRYLVAATGFPVRPATVKNGAKVYHFYAEDVHDFAWAASPDFIYAEEKFSDKHVPGVKIKLYLDPAHQHLRERYMMAAKRSLSRYSEWYGPYPYSTLSIVVPPDGGDGAAGMEYPTLITAWEASTGRPGLELERVVAHEIAHQYWYGIVASNEMEEPWLDEAFTSYSEMRLMQAEYDVEPNYPLEASRIIAPAALNRYAWDYADHAHYAENVYTRGKLVLLAIEREIGADAMDQVLRNYYRKWKFNHPTTEDFLHTLEQTTRRSWKSFFEQFVYGDRMLDYAVERIRVRPVERDGRTMYENSVTFVRNDGFAGPVQVHFSFRDGTAVRQTWDGQDQRKAYRLVTPAPIAWVAVDPEHRLVLENRHYNNILHAEVNPEWKVRWNLMISRAVESILGWMIG